jgi:mRNA-degrading endonuclease toxin of MazEF toxin-antitoxin module
LIEPDADNNLRQISVALAFQLTAVDKNFVKNKLGAISKENMMETWKSLDGITGRDQI